MGEFYTKNKETNTFRFKSFADRINEIDVRQSTLYRIGHENEELDDGEDETLFAQTLRKWMVLNLTTEYSAFYKKCQGIVTLPQLIYKKDEIAGLFESTLGSCSVLSLESVLDALAAFAKDIREDFYPYFDKFFDKLIYLLRGQDSDQVEWTFKCLAHLFKILRPFLKRNMTVVLRKVVPLLDQDANPDYVVNFASECFSFVARDMRDFDKFLHLTMKHVTETMNDLAGIGKLFFELVRGVGGNFHSVAKDFLNALFRLLTNRKFEQDLVLAVVSCTIRNILEEINQNSVSLLWKVMSDAVNETLENTEKLPEGCILSLVKIMKETCEWKNGKAITDVAEVITLFVKFVDSVKDTSILSELSRIATQILHSDCVKLQQIDASRLICKMLTVQSQDVYEEFVWSMSKHPQFEILVLPSFINYFESEYDIRKLDLLIKITENRSEWNLECTWKKLPIKFKKEATITWLENSIEHFNPKALADAGQEACFLSVLTYPHLMIANSGSIGELLKKNVLEIDFDSHADVVLAILETLSKLDVNMEESFLEKILFPLTSSKSEKLPTLLIFNEIFNYAQRTKKNIFTKKLFSQIQQNVGDNLSSSHVMARKISAKILSFFKEQGEEFSVYQIFYDAIKIELTVHTVREQLLLLQKLSPNGHLFQKINSEAVKLDCLKFLLGHLYQNFKLIWEPTMKIISEYAEKLGTDDFWSIYRVKLEETDSAITLGGNFSPACFEDHFKFKTSHYLYTQIDSVQTKVDFRNYRNLLWKNLSNFGLMIEVKNRDIVSFFLNFVQIEYKKEDESNSLTWNVKGENKTNCDDKEVDAFPVRTKAQNMSQSLAVATLSAMLEVFAKQVNPKQLYREPELKEFYLELLTGTNEQLQKLALDCLMRYKLKSVLPYKDHLYALIDDKKFKDELVNFKLDVESKMIESEHRAEVMTFLLRILYGKMRSKTSNKYISSQMRRSIVLRFLTGCQTDEIFWFLRMAFENYQDLLTDNLERIPVRVAADFDITKVFSPKKLKSALNLLDLIRKNFGGLMATEVLVYMLKIIILAGSVCRCFFEKSDEVDKKFLAVFRNLRSQGLLCLVEFFEHFQDFAWEEEHIKSFLDVYVWPVLSKMPEECLHSPTPLLKLFIIWSQNARNYKLLATEGPNKQTPLGVSISLLTSDKTSPIIRKTIMEMIERVLIIEEDEQRDNKTKPKSILSLYVDQILGKLMSILNAKGRKTGFGKRELYVLSRITEMDVPSSTCDIILKLILPIAAGKARVNMSEESTAELVITLKNLISKVDTPEMHVRSILPLFEKITDISTRKQLCKLFNCFGKQPDNANDGLKDLAEIAEKLNAWDRKWVEQPDYDKRLSALREVRKKLDCGEINMELGLLVVYNCFYVLTHDKDLGLRDNASQCMRSLVPGLIKKYSGNAREVSYIVEDVMFNLIRRTLRDKNDLVRNESIHLLGEMVRHCSDAHRVLKDLEGLACREDLEVDFFENVTHLQLHRHGRALLKFCSYARETERLINSKTLTQFLLPLATRYLLTEKFASKNSLVDAAIDSVGTVCRFLPWTQYYAVLRFYLQKMRHCREYHKQCIRIIIAILDAFHFELTDTASKDYLQPNAENSKATEETKTEEESGANLLDEDLDSELDELDKDKLNDHQKDPSNEKINQQSIVRPSKLSPSAIRNIIQTITKSLLPSLNKSITELSSYESKHKINRRRVNFEREEDESLRVPIALAIAKLLKKLPKETFDANINGVFLKVCTFLKSPVKSVRMLTRDILKKIMIAIGAEYLPLLLSTMTSLLTKGFQVHVLSVTLHSLLDCLRADLKPHTMENSLQSILNVTLNDIFGDASEEKEVEKIGAATPEAKPSTKSYLSLQIAAQHIPQNCLLDLLVPFKHYLQSTQSKKVILKVQDCFQKINVGLAENKNISPKVLVEFIYGTLSESIPDLVLPQTARTQEERERLAHEKKDCFLIPQEPRSRSGAVRKVVKTNARANAYLLTEFGLELLHIILRRQKIASTEYLEPLVPFLKSSLESTHVRICILSIKCLTSIWQCDMELNELKKCMDSILKQTFVILHKYFNFGVARKDDNFQLVRSAMKALGCVISNCDYYDMTDENIAQLLFYISQDVNDSDKQPVAFSLLKSLIDKQKYSKDLFEIMQKLCEISITSESDHARDEARTVLLNFVTAFHKEKKTETVLKFFISQLNYEVRAGRMSAVKFIESSVRKYPLEALNRKSEVLFLALGTRFVNEDVPECRKLIAQCLELLLSRIMKAERQKLFEMSLVFFESNKAAVREMAACLCSRFIEVEKTDFLSKAVQLLPVLETHLGYGSPNTPGKFVRQQIDSEKMDDSKSTADDLQEAERARDHFIIQIQNCMLKMFSLCPEILAENSLDSVIDSIAYESQKLLAYEHEWVRLNSVKILNEILARMDVSCLLGISHSTDESEYVRLYIYSDPENELKSLTLDLCAQLQPGQVDEEFASEITKCLMFIANFIKSIETNKQTDPPIVNLQWLIKRVRYAIHGEVAKTPKLTILRNSLFDWIEGLIALLNIEELLLHSPAMISVLIREISDDDANIDAKVKQKAIRITNRIRKKIGDEIYDQLRLAAQKKLLMKRASRKKELAQEKIIDPVRAAKRKTNQKERKKDAKRKKLEIIRGKGNGLTKRKRKIMEDVF